MPEQTPAMDGLYYFRDTPERIADGIHLISAFGNSVCIETTDGLVIVDACVRPMGARLLEQIRRISDQPIRYVVYTHGHFDHAFGVWALLEEAERRGRPRPQIVGHELVPKRFDRYLELDGLHDHINRIQFALPPQAKVVVPEQFHYPDIGRDGMACAAGRAHLRPAPRHGRNGRRHLGLDSRTAHGLHRRSLPLVLPQHRQSLQGATVRSGMGRGARSHRRS